VELRPIGSDGQQAKQYDDPVSNHNLQNDEIAGCWREEFPGKGTGTSVFYLEWAWASSYYAD
jgi:hypothetical protein